MRGKGAGSDCIPYARFSAPHQGPEAAHGSPRGELACDYMNLALSEAGGFSDALRRGALPAFDNVALCKSRSTIRRAASMLPQALVNSGGSSGPPLRRYRRVACTE